MRVLLAGVVVGLCTVPGGAAQLHCSFTEPFFSIAYDTATGKVILTSADEFDGDGNLVPRLLGENVKVVREDKWKDFETLYLKAGDETILTIKITGQGSDGMSDNQYPFEGIYGERNIGGCETDKIKSFDVYQLYEDFGVKYF